MILKGKKTGQQIMVCVPSDQKINMEAIAGKLGERFEFENPAVIKAKFGIEVGGVPPFGNLLGLPTYFANDISKETKAAFNCGYRTKSIIMNSKDLISLINPELF